MPERKDKLLQTFCDSLKNKYIPLSATVLTALGLSILVHQNTETSLPVEPINQANTASFSITRLPIEYGGFFRAALEDGLKFVTTQHLTKPFYGDNNFFLDKAAYRTDWFRPQSSNLSNSLNESQARQIAQDLAARNHANVHWDLKPGLTPQMQTSKDLSVDMRYTKLPKDTAFSLITVDFKFNVLKNTYTHPIFLPIVISSELDPSSIPEIAGKMFAFDPLAKWNTAPNTFGLDCQISESTSVINSSPQIIARKHVQGCSNGDFKLNVQYTTAQP